MLDQALTRLDAAARRLGLDTDILEELKCPRETTKVRPMIRMDDGLRKSFMACCRLGRLWRTYMRALSRFARPIGAHGTQQFFTC
jgi:hypothetical protein